MKRNKLILKADGIDLAAEVFIPEEAFQNYPALCLCHGIPAGPPEPGRPGYDQFAEQFCAADFITLIFNFRGAGESGGNIDLQGWTRDLSAAIDYLYNLEHVDKSRMLLLGSSAGGAVSVEVAAGDTRVAAVATFACPAYFDLPKQFNPDVLIERYRSIGAIRDNDFPPSKEKWFKGFTDLSPLRSVDKISPRPLLLVHGDEDEVVPVKHAYELFEKAGEPKELKIISGAGHRLRHVPEAVDIAARWLEQFKNRQ